MGNFLRKIKNSIEKVSLTANVAKALKKTDTGRKAVNSIEKVSLTSNVAKALTKPKSSSSPVEQEVIESTVESEIPYTDGIYEENATGNNSLMAGIGSGSGSVLYVVIGFLAIVGVMFTIKKLKK